MNDDTFIHPIFGRVHIMPAAPRLKDNRPGLALDSGEFVPAGEIPPPRPESATCPCGDRPKSACPGEWGPGCDLGANEKHVAVVSGALTRCIDCQWPPGMPCPTCRNLALSSLEAPPLPSVGESSFEPWFSGYNPAGKGDKRRARDAYEAGVRDPLAMAGSAVTASPIDMVLHCPACGMQHIDAPCADIPGKVVRDGKLVDVPCVIKANDPNAWTNPPHRSHLCHGCGHIWRPADVPTNGVAAVKTAGKNDSPALRERAYRMNDRVRKKSGSEWQGRVVGFYSTKLTPEGYAVESEAHAGSVQIYPVGALELVTEAE